MKKSEFLDRIKGMAFFLLVFFAIILVVEITYNPSFYCGTAHAPPCDYWGRVWYDVKRLYVPMLIVAYFRDELTVLGRRLVKRLSKKR
jgi:hypothetical protein